jgi:uncharacterized protein involved in exopolysaccharide biosynthesis
MSENELAIDPRRLLRKVVHRWYWIFFSMILGGLLGLAFSYLQSPIFQASAIVSVDLDFARTANIDEIVHRRAMDRVRVLMLSNETLEIVASSLDDHGEVSLDPDQLRNLIRLEERETGWELKTLHPDPETAVAISNAWAVSVLDELEEAVKHAWRAAELQMAFYRLGCVLTPTEADPQQANWVCTSEEPELDPDQLILQLQQEAEASRGILPAMSYGLIAPAAITTTPIYPQRGLFILGGILIGLLIGIALVLLRAFEPSRGTTVPGQGRVADR